jgi:uncharacterized membrane protein YdfJ with MMPL/SSD domain
VVVVGTTPSADPQAALKQVSTRIAGLPDVAAVTPPKVNQSGDTALLTVIPKSGPSSMQTEGRVGAIGGESDQLRQSSGARIVVTGQTAANIDVSAKLSGAMLPYLGLIVGLAFILLVLVFMSVIVPLKATVGVAGFVLAEATHIQSIGFALAFGVAVDAFVVRMTIVPAAMSLLGNRAWWLPKWLDRVLPNVDVEGPRPTESSTATAASA